MIRKEADRAAIGEIRFFSLRFLQLVVEVVIIDTYFAMALGVHLREVTDKSASTPSISWQSFCLVVVFLLYFAWDMLDVHLASEQAGWRRKASIGGWVSLGFAIVFFLCYVVIHIWLTHTEAEVFWAGCILVGLLYGYRVVQSWARVKWTIDRP